jgi:ferric-dicitrate binding protein FerR (iron transport regulator)
MTSRESLAKEGLPQPEHEELATLLNSLADGTLSEAEERRLRAILDRGEPARRVFREFATLHACLYWDYAVLLAPGLPPRSGPLKDDGGWWPSMHRAATVMMMVAAAAAATVAVWMLTANPADWRQQAAGGNALATVTRTRFLQAGEGRQHFPIGQPIEAGRISLAGGAVELTLRNGVVVVFEGPGEFDLAGELEATLHDGNLVVRMPDGMKGFVVRTPATDVLDLGTEFAVSVGPGQATDVQVYDGAVMATTSRQREPTQMPKRLAAGEASRFLSAANSEPVPLAFRPERFVRRLPDDVGVPYDRPFSKEEIAQEFGPARHAAITVHRAPAGMAIDGRLDEWADKPGFSGTLDGTASCPEWAEGRMMYDEKCLYVAARVGDPMPLRSIIDPEIDAGWGWRGGAVQVRISTDRRMGWPAQGNTLSYFTQRKSFPTPEQEQAARNPRLAHLTMWFHSPSQTPCLTINHGALFGELQVNPAGFAGAFVADADGKGYTMEYAIPWSLLGCADDAPQRGDVLAAVWQVLWGDEDGRMRRKQMVEVRNPGEPLEINVWERAATWGRAEYR